MAIHQGFSETPRRLHIGEWIVEPEILRIRRDGTTEVLEPRVMGLLVALARAGGGVVSKEQLLDEVWDDNVVAQGVVSLTVYKLRRALGDSSREPRYIETIARRGYRLIVPVRRVDPRQRSASHVEVSTSAAWRSQTFGRWPWSARIARRGAVFGLVFLAGGLGGTLLTSRDTASDAAVPGVAQQTRARPLTALPGIELRPALSPDGTEVAFIRRPDVAAEIGWDVWIQRFGDAEPRRLTAGPATDDWPVWSADGRFIAFERRRNGKRQLLRIPRQGGEISHIADLSAGESWGLAWAPSSEAMVFTRGDSVGGSQLALLELEQGTETALTHPRPGVPGDGYPAFSPNGRQLAFARSATDHTCRLMLLLLDTSEERPITEPLGAIHGVAWSADGRSLIYGLQVDQDFGLWQVEISGGDPWRLPVANGRVAFPSVAAGRIVYEQHREVPAQIRQRSLRSDAKAHIWNASTAGDAEPRYSPDGQTVAFRSRRRGGLDVWLAARDGSRSERLTELEAAGLGGLAWSPSGDRIAFTALVEGQEDLYVIGVDSRYLRRLTYDESNEYSAGWSADGHSLYYSSNRAGIWQIWQVAANGGPPRRVSPVEGLAPRADGKGLTLTRHDGRLFYLNLEDGAMHEIATEPAMDWPAWAGRQVVAERTYVLRSDAPSTLSVLEPESRKLFDLLSLGPERPLTFSVSPSGDEILYTIQSRPEVDLVWSRL